MRKPLLLIVLMVLVSTAALMHMPAAADGPSSLIVEFENSFGGLVSEASGVLSVNLKITRQAGDGAVGDTPSAGIVVNFTYFDNAGTIPVALPGVDYVGPQSLLVLEQQLMPLQQGAAFVIVPVTLVLVNDTQPEPTETIYMSMSVRGTDPILGPAYLGSTSSLTATLTSDDRLPEIVHPTGQVITTIDSILYSWTNIEAASYELAVWSASYTFMPFYRTNLSPVCSQLTCTFENNFLLNNGEYHAWVRETGGAWSGPFAFSVAVPRPASPTMGSATNTNTSRPTIPFTLAGDAIYASEFWVFVNKKGLHDAGDTTTPVVNRWYTRTQLCGTPTGTECAFTPLVDLADNTDYYAWVMGYGPGGFAIGGWVSSSFFVRTPTAPPFIIAPTGVIADGFGSPEYTWLQTQGAESYELAVWKADYSTMIFWQTNLPASTFCNGTSCTVQPVSLPSDPEPDAGSDPTADFAADESARLPGSGTYHAFVRTTNGAWQGPFPFTLNAPPPGTPTMGSVLNTNTLQPTGTFTLNGDALYATHFWVVINQKELHDAGIFNLAPVNRWYTRAELCGTPTSASCSVTAGVPLNDNTHYYLWIMAYGPGGYAVNSSYSGWVSSTFRVDLIPDPGLPVLQPVEIGEGTPRFTFSTDANTTQHSIYIYHFEAGSWAVFNSVYTKAASAGITCSANTCTIFDDAINLTNDSYAFWVNGIGPGGVSTGGAWNNGYAGPGDLIPNNELGDFMISLQPPDLLTSVSANVSSGNLVGTWNAGPRTTDFNIWIGHASTYNTYFFQPRSAIQLGCPAGGNLCSFSVPLASLGISSGTPVYVAVQAVGAGGARTSGGFVNNGYVFSASVNIP